MDIKQYQKDVKRTCADLGSLKDDTYHMLMGITTENGELQDMFKKHFAYGKTFDVVNMGEEIGDLMWYVANLCNMYNLDLEDILEHNINKLKARYPEKFDEEHAINRDLDTERKILSA